MDDPYRIGPAPVPLDADAQASLQRDLGAGETLLWVGRPPRGIVFEKTDLFMIPFSIFWGGFSFFWEANVLRSGAPFVMALFGLPFVAIGIYITVGRFLHDAWKRRRTVYGITNERILIAQQGGTTLSLDLRGVDVAIVEDHADGTGTITFGDPAMRRRQPKPPKLSHIPGAHDVHQLIREQRNALERLRLAGPVRIATEAPRIVTEAAPVDAYAAEVFPAERKNDA
jgi:hypothetical protein